MNGILFNPLMTNDTKRTHLLNKSTAFAATNLFKQVHSFSTIKGLKLQFQKNTFE